MKLIVGLGNPGREYAQTRHNMGFIVIDRILKDLNLELKVDNKLQAAYVKTKINGEDVILAKPLTYMNLSGQAVINLMNFYKIEKDDIIIISDDTAIELGKIRLRASGSHGGQNGLRDIINRLSSDQFKRLRVGIGDNKLIDKKDFVLGKLTSKEIDFLMPVFDRCRDLIFDWVNQMSFENLMNKYNTPLVK
ncbi:MAG TPA: aminoacyl-tRNA hydrolase [Acholeplasma sp.]|nr:aminoacyl-tRNA hydrolase [Acholeplasma sp.]